MKNYLTLDFFFDSALCCLWIYYVSPTFLVGCCVCLYTHLCVIYLFGFFLIAGILKQLGEGKNNSRKLSMIFVNPNIWIYDERNSSRVYIIWKWLFRPCHTPTKIDLTGANRSSKKKHWNYDTKLDFFFARKLDARFSQQAYIDLVTNGFCLNFFFIETFRK